MDSWLSIYIILSNDLNSLSLGLSITDEIVNLNNRWCQGVLILRQAVLQHLHSLSFNLSRILWIDFHFPSLQRNQQWCAVEEEGSVLQTCNWTLLMIHR